MWCEVNGVHCTHMCAMLRHDFPVCLSPTVATDNKPLLSMAFYLSVEDDIVNCVIPGILVFRPFCFEIGEFVVSK